MSEAVCDSDKMKLTQEGSLAKFDMNEILNCMQCGFCLPACPTYRQTGMEYASPRGRIALMKGVAKGDLAVDEQFEYHMNLCLGCRACETACPAGVPYGGLVETAREIVEEHKKENMKPSAAKKYVFDTLFKNPKKMNRLGTALWVAQTAGLQTLADKTGIINVLPRPLAEMQKAVEKVASPWERKKRARMLKSDRRDAPKVGFFTGCVMDALFFETNQATAKLAQKAGCDVIFAEDQACCGALHAHTGDKVGAKELAKRNIAAFERAEVDYIVNNAGGCGSALKEYHHWFQDEPEWRERAMKIVSKMRDANELLAELPPLTFSKRLDAIVTYQDSCHLAHGQGVRNQPRQLIQSIPGVEYVELKDADSCCGSAGIYNVTNYDMSMDILDAKMEQVKDTKARYIVTSNPGCLLQMKNGIIRSGLQGKMEALHVMDLLARAL